MHIKRKHRIIFYIFAYFVCIMHSTPISQNDIHCMHKQPLIQDKQLMKTLDSSPKKIELYSSQSVDMCCLLLSGMFFHISIAFNKMMFGDAFNYQSIMPTPPPADQNITTDTRHVIKQDQGIIYIHDGKKMPLILGSIPCSLLNLSRLRTIYDQAPQEPIILFTLNRPFECRWAGLTDVVQNDPNLTQYHYPTTDFNAPSFIDLVRIVRDIDARDIHGDNGVAYIHCKAGRGRSATGVAAYLAYVCHVEGVSVTFDEIHAYIKRLRPHVGINRLQKAAYNLFYTELQKAGSFANLCDLYKAEIDARDKEVSSYQ